jgi:hypothetical protein
LPHAEQGAARHLEDKISELDSYDRQFAVALALFDQAHELRADPRSGQDRWVYSQWQFIAARDFVLTGNHFRSTLHSLKASVEKCPTILKQISTTNIQAAIAGLDKAFPALIEVRHAVAHSADQTFSPAEQRKHTFIARTERAFSSAAACLAEILYTHAMGIPDLDFAFPCLTGRLVLAGRRGIDCIHDLVLHLAKRTNQPLFRARRASLQVGNFSANVGLDDVEALGIGQKLFVVGQLCSDLREAIGNRSLRQVRLAPANGWLQTPVDSRDGPGDIDGLGVDEYGPGFEVVAK